MKGIILQGITIEEFNSTIETMVEKKLEAFADMYYPERLLSAKEASKMLGISFNTLKGLVEDGIVKPIVTGGDPRYSLRELSKIAKR